jgi:hypothetical protein
MRQITEDAATIEVDYTHAPAECSVCTLDTRGDFLDVIETFEGAHAADKAHALGQRLATENTLAFTERRVPD